MSKSTFMQWLDELINPLNARIQRDIAAMRDDQALLKNSLVPLRPEELDLLSSQYLPQEAKKRKKKAPEKGIFATIYQEPFIAWSYQAYDDKDKQAVLVAQTYRQEYLYKRKGREVEIVIGPYRVGILTANGQLISSRKRETLAQFGKGNGSFLPILTYGREVGALVLPSDTSLPMPRAFAYLVADMNENERELFLSMAILQMVRWKTDL